MHSLNWTGVISCATVNAHYSFCGVWSEAYGSRRFRSHCRFSVERDSPRIQRTATNSESDRCRNSCSFGAQHSYSVRRSPSPTLAQAHSVFHFSKEVHWGNAVLPPGDYVITSLDVKNTGAVLTFATPNSVPRSPISDAEVAYGPSPLWDSNSFTIHNPRSQPVPSAAAQTIYLSACRVVEQEFNRTKPLRPRVTLVLGSELDRVYYPGHEIQLKKWDDYKFAQGVVILAVNDLLPEGEKSLLSELALVEAESTVDVHELKSTRTSPLAEPRHKGGPNEKPGS